MYPDGPRNTSVTITLNEYEKRMFETMAEVYDSSQAGVGRMWLKQDYQRYFGSIHPDALERHDIDMDALVRGVISPEEIDEQYKVDMGDMPAIPATDGGATAAMQPASYSPTHTKQDLASSGPELTWSELKEAVEANWDDEDEQLLEIHPDRVRASADVEFTDDGRYSEDDYALKAKQDVLEKILVGLLRTNDEVSEKQIEATILQYTDHQISRSDHEAGKRYKIQTYKDDITDHFIAHPDPLEDTYYTSEEVAKRRFAKEVEETIADLVDKTWVLDPKEHVKRTGVPVKEDATQWLEDLAEFRQGLGFLQAITTDGTWSERLSELDDPLGEWPNADVAARKTYNELLAKYVHVNEWARFAVADAVLELANDDVLEDDILRDDEFVDVRPDRPSEPVFQWVADREEPLSSQAQIDAVSERL